MAAQIGFEGRVVTINVDGYGRSSTYDYMIEDKILYDTIDNLFQKYDAVFLEYNSSTMPNVGLMHDIVYLKSSGESGKAYSTMRGLMVVDHNSEGGGGEPA